MSASWAFLAERPFRWLRQGFRYATGTFIAARGAVPDWTPPGSDRRYCGRQPAGCRRLRLLRAITDDNRLLWHCICGAQKVDDHWQCLVGIFLVDPVSASLQHHCLYILQPRRDELTLQRVANRSLTGDG